MEMTPGTPRGRFVFPTDDEGEEFCLEIAHLMAEYFGINEAEAVERINSRWAGLTVDCDSIAFHEPPDFWAKDIYIGSDIFWWTFIPAQGPPPPGTTRERLLRRQAE